MAIGNLKILFNIILGSHCWTYYSITVRTIKVVSRTIPAKYHDYTSYRNFFSIVWFNVNVNLCFKTWRSFFPSSNPRQILGLSLYVCVVNNWTVIFTWLFSVSCSESLKNDVFPTELGRSKTVCLLGKEKSVHKKRSSFWSNLSNSLTLLKKYNYIIIWSCILMLDLYVNFAHKREGRWW